MLNILKKKLRKSSTFRVIYSDIVILIKSLLRKKAFAGQIGIASTPFKVTSLSKNSFAQQGEDLIIDRILSRKLNRDIFSGGIYVDIGAYDAIDHSVTYMLYLRGWRGIAFDPSKNAKRTFQKFRPKDIFINAAVGEQDLSHVDFFAPEGNLEIKSHTSSKLQPDGNDMRKISVPQVNINEELKRQSISKVDVLSIDIEGAELEVLTSFDFIKFQPSIVAVEIHCKSTEECLMTDVAILLKKANYHLVASAVITQFFVRGDLL